MRERPFIASHRSTWYRTCRRKRAPLSSTPASSQPHISHLPRGRAPPPTRGTHSPSRAPRFAVASPPPKSTSPSGTARSATPKCVSSAALAACERTEVTRRSRRRSHPFERWCTDSERGTRRAISRRAATDIYRHMRRDFIYEYIYRRYRLYNDWDCATTALITR